MHKFSDNSKMLAIAALAVLAENHAHLTSPGPNPPREEEEEEEEEGGGVFPDLVLRLGQLLEDDMEHIRVPAAIALHCLGREHKKVQQASYHLLDIYLLVSCMASFPGLPVQTKSRNEAMSCVRLIPIPSSFGHTNFTTHGQQMNLECLGMRLGSRDINAPVVCSCDTNLQCA